MSHLLNYVYDICPNETHGGLVLLKSWVDGIAFQFVRSERKNAEKAASTAQKEKEALEVGELTCLLCCFRLIYTILCNKKRHFVENGGSVQGAGTGHCRVRASVAGGI